MIDVSRPGAEWAVLAGQTGRKNQRGAVLPCRRRSLQANERPGSFFRLIPGALPSLMTRELLVRFLQSTGYISAPQAEEIAGGFAPRVIGKNELLLLAGKVSDEYLFLDQGIMRAFAHDDEGREVTTGFFSAGQVVLEVASFFNRTPSQEHLQALTDCAGWSISHQQLNALFHTRPEFREFGRGVLVRELARLKTRLLALTTETATRRYESLLKATPEILQHVPLKHIASFLGVTDSTLSRIRAGSSKG